MKTGKKNLDIIGATEYVDVVGIQDIPAKVDTGADSSAIWASQIRMSKDGILEFCLFGKDSPFYTGEIIKRKDFKVAVIRSSSGHEQIRYRTHLSINLKGHKIKVLFSLANRSNNNYPILIGRRTIAGKFLVDVSEKHTNIRSKSKKTLIAQQRLEKDPYLFHKKYVEGAFENPSNIILEKKG